MTEFWIVKTAPGLSVVPPPTSAPFGASVSGPPLKVTTGAAAPFVGAGAAAGRVTVLSPITTTGPTDGALPEPCVGCCPVGRATGTPLKVKVLPGRSVESPITRPPFAAVEKATTLLPTVIEPDPGLEPEPPVAPGGFWLFPPC